jgi:hypothetical protein
MGRCVCAAHDGSGSVAPGMTRRTSVKQHVLTGECHGRRTVRPPYFHAAQSYSQNFSSKFMPQILHISHRSCHASAPAAGPLRPGAHARARAGSRLHARAGAPLTMAEPHPPKNPHPR